MGGYLMVEWEYFQCSTQRHVPNWVSEDLELTPEGAAPRTRHGQGISSDSPWKRRAALCLPSPDSLLLLLGLTMSQPGLMPASPCPVHTEPHLCDAPCRCCSRSSLHCNLWHREPGTAPARGRAQSRDDRGAGLTSGTLACRILLDVLGGCNLHTAIGPHTARG